MNENVKNKLEEIYSIITANFNSVVNIFNHFYGEDFVDVQNKLELSDFIASIRYKRLELYIHINTDNILRNYKDESIDNLIKNNVSEDVINEYLTLVSLPESIENIKFRFNRNSEILVYFPEVRVTNEHDKYHDIKKLYVKLEINLLGSMIGKFKINRSEYTNQEIKKDYLHSHAPGLPKPFSSFIRVCLGNGPINNTIALLNAEFDEDLWGLFCYELSLFVKTESLDGGPHRRLSRFEQVITNNADLSEYRIPTEKINNSDVFSFMGSDIIVRFIQYYLQNNNLSWYVTNGVFKIASHIKEFTLEISNKFITWINQNYDDHNLYRFLYSNAIIKNVEIHDDKFYLIPADQNTYPLYEHLQQQELFYFKNEIVKLHIEDVNVKTPIDEIRGLHILNATLCAYIKQQLELIVTHEYKQTLSSESVSTEQHSEFIETRIYI